MTDMTDGKVDEFLDSIIDPPPPPVSTIIPPSPPRTPTPSPEQLREHHAYIEEVLEDHPELTIPSPSSSTAPDPLSMDMYAFVARAKPASAAEEIEPKTLRQARKGGHWDCWSLAAYEEYCSLTENGTWVLVDAPKDRKILSGKWVWKLKKGSRGEVVRHKARWVVRGFEQQEGTDFFETFASVVKPMSYKAIFAITAALDWELEQMDVKTAFLYGEVEEEVYVRQPTGMEDPKYPNKVCKLKKALYGLKQAPRVWYKTLTKFLKSRGYKPLDADSSVFFGHDTIVAIYVDDLLIAGPNMQTINKLKKGFHSEFKMTDLGACSYYLGMKIERDRKHRILTLSQKGYLQGVLEKFDMLDCAPKDTPMESGAAKIMVPPPEGYTATAVLRKEYQSIVGSLMYAMLGTRPDIAYSVSVVSRFCANPTETHMKAAKRIMRYLQGTLNLKLVFSGGLSHLTGFSDADWAGDHDTRRSTSGYVFHLGSGAISWSSKRQPTVALSSCESEYFGQTQAAKEAIWLRRFLQEVCEDKFGGSVPTVIFCDNQGAIALAKNPTNHARSKHIDTQTHWVREKVESGEIELQYISTKSQVADGLTKPLARDAFEQFRDAIGVY
jgi:hypothetical protein